MTDSTAASDATTDRPPTPPEAPLPPAPEAHAAIANPFVPVYKEPWLNPAKRTKTLVAALVAAVVLLAAGFAIGVGVGDHHGRRGGAQIERGGYGWIPNNGGPVLRRGGVLYGPGQNGVRPGNLIPRQATTSGVPMPVPVPSHT